MSDIDRISESDFEPATRFHEPDSSFQLAINIANTEFADKVSEQVELLRAAIGDPKRNVQGWLAVVNIAAICAERYWSFHPRGRDRIRSAVIKGHPSNNALQLLMICLDSLEAFRMKGV